MQNENPTSIASDRPSLQQQQQQQSFGGDDIKSKSGIVNSSSSSSSSSKHSTHQHHREDDPVVGSFMGLRVEEQRPQNESDSDIRGSSEIKVEDAGRDESQQGGAQDVQGSEQSAVDKSSIFDRDGSQGSQEDLSKGIGMAHGFGGYSEIGHHKRQQEQQEQQLQGQDQGQESGVSESSDIGQQLNASQDWFKPSEAGETSVDLSDKIGEQQNVSQDLSLSSNAGRGFDLGQQQEGGGDSSSRSNQPDQDWSVGSQASSSVGQSSVDNFDLSQQQQQQPSGISDIGQQQSDRVGQDWAQSSAFGQFPQQQQQQQQSVGSSDLQGVDASRWPQNQGVWNPGLQGDSSSADKDISSQYDASGILIRSSDLGQTVSQDKGPYALDIQDQGKQQDEDRQPQEQQLSAGSESQPLLGSQDAGDFSYGSTASGYGQGLSNPGADSQQQQQQDEERQWNVQDFGKGDLRDQSQLAGDEDAAGFSQQSNVQDFGKGDLRDQSQLSGDKATFQHDAEEKPAGDDDHWRRVGDRQFVGEGEDRVHGMAREDFI